MRRLLSLPPVFAAGLLLASIAWPAHLAAQVAGSMPPHAPDLLGIYTGMPADQAKVQLQKHSSDVYVQYATNGSEGFGLSVPGMPADRISVSITQAPSVPEVWRVERYQAFSNLQPVSRSALLHALHQKYGKEAFSRSPDGGHMQIYWIYDADGQPRRNPDSGLMACDAVVPSSMKGETARRCAQDFFALYIAILSDGADGDSVQSYTMVLINLPYASAASKLTTDAKRAIADQEKRDEDQKRVSRPVPQF